MVSAAVNTEDWPTFGLKRLLQPVEQAKGQKKYLFIWDKQGAVGTYMKYKGTLADIAPQVTQVVLGRKAYHEVGEEVRRLFVYAMQQGDNLCLDIDQTKPDFMAMNVEGTFLSDKFFDYDWLEQKENHLPYVRESEKRGGRVGYYRSNEFGMVIRSGAADEAELSAQIAKIPNFETQFEKCIIE